MRPPPPDIDGFETGAFLGAGGMGAVWAATHQRTGLPVALKVLHRSVEPTAFSREVRAISRLDHPSILSVYDQGYSGGRPFLVMAQAAGVLSIDTPLPIRTPLLSLLDALAHAHARGVIHQDIKPSNLLVGADGRIRLADFGVAVFLDEAVQDRSSGSLAYMAPEQLAGAGRDIGPWTDLFALGCVAFELLCGRRLHAGPERPAFHRHLHVGLGEAAGRWLEGLLGLRPQQRFQRAADAAWALRAIPETEWLCAQPAPRQPSLTVTGTMTADETLASLPAWTPLSAPLRPVEVAPALTQAPMPDDWRVPYWRTGPPKGLGLGLFALRPIPLSGREAERDRLWAALQRAAAGQPGAVSVAGPAGVGKSHLARWLCERAEETGAAEAIRVQRDRDGGSHSLVEAIRERFRCANLSGAALAERLQRAMPGADALVTQLAAAMERGSEVVNTLWAALSAWAGRRPVLLWLDDADESPATRALLARARRARAPLRILVVATRRQEQPSDKADELWLSPLRGSALRSLLTRSLYLQPALANDLLRACPDDPALLLLVVQDWVQRDRLIVSPEGFALRPGAELILPGSLHDAWLQRFRAQIPEGSPEWRMLERAAAMGPSVPQALWARVCEDLGDVGPVTELLLRSGLIEETADGWAFRNGLLAESLAAFARDAGRLAEHSRHAAEVILALHEGIIIEPVRLGIARLWRQCGEREAAIEAGLWRVFWLRTYSEIWRWLRELEQVEEEIEAVGLPEDHPHRLQAMMYRMVRLQHTDPSRAQAMFQTIRARKQSPWPIEMEGEWLSVQQLYARFSQDLELALEVKQQLLVLSDPSWWSRNYTAQTIVVKLLVPHRAQRPDQLAEAVRDLIAMRDTLPDGYPRRSVITCFIQGGEALWMAGQQEESRQLVTEACQEALALGLMYHAGAAYDRLAELALTDGNRAEAHGHVRSALRCFSAIDHSCAPGTRMELGMWDLEAGDVAAATANLRQAEVELRQQNNHRYGTVCNALMLWLELVLGDRPAALRYAEAVEASGYTFHRYATVLERVAAHLVEMGERELAALCLRKALAQREALNDPASASVTRDRLAALSR